MEGVGLVSLAENGLLLASEAETCRAGHCQLTTDGEEVPSRPPLPPSPRPPKRPPPPPSTFPPPPPQRPLLPRGHHQRQASPMPQTRSPPLM